MKKIKLKGGRNMERKYVLGIVACSIIAILGISMISAFGLGNGFMVHELTEEDKTEMQEQMNAMQTAIENGDYETWESLMEEKIAKMQEQITEENFNKIIEMHQQQEERMTEMKEQRERFCEENDCPDFEEGEFPGSFKGHGIGIGPKHPSAEDNSISE